MATSLEIFANIVSLGSVVFAGLEWEWWDSARSGSTILSISAEKLAEMQEGIHTVSAAFADGETVEISFNLMKAAADAPEEVLPDLTPVIIILAVFASAGWKNTGSGRVFAGASRQAGRGYSDF